MAAASPVVVTSSSPPLPTRALSVTPPRARQSTPGSLSPSSSSPRLPSPSVFVRSIPVALKSGSRAHEVPAGVDSGFASAARLWRSKYFSAEVHEGEHDGSILAGKTVISKEAQADSKKKSSSGKLVRPSRRVGDSRAPAVRHDVISSTVNRDNEGESRPLPTYPSEALHSEPLAETTERNTLSPNENNRAEFYQSGTEYQHAYVLDKNIESCVETKKHCRKVHNDIVDGSTPLKPSKKPRKARAKSTTRGSLPKTAGKKDIRYKSEPVVIDSDEPDPEQTRIQHNSAAEPLKSTTCHGDLAEPKPRKNRTIVDEPVGLLAIKTHGKGPECSTLNTSEALAEENSAFVETSLYFRNSETSHDDTASNSRSQEQDFTKTACAEVECIIDVPTLLVRRRKQWTPVKNSSAAEEDSCRNVNLDIPLSPTKSANGRKLLESMSHFQYDQANETLPVPISEKRSGEAPTKRRRVDLIDGLPILDDVTKPTELASKRAKRTKSLKKPQTITALATAVYRKPTCLDKAVERLQQDSAQIGDAPTTSSCIPSVSTEPKRAVKRQRKPRGKANDDKPTVKNPATKSKKSASKKISEEHVQLLYSPTQASAQLHDQAFIFGTSSQLATDESPGFIRDMQLAILESETANAPSQAIATLLSPQFQLGERRGKSSIRVPTAPHGTALSVIQNERELWCVAARGRDGGLFRHRSLLGGSVPRAKSIVGADTCKSVVEGPCMDRASSITTKSLKTYAQQRDEITTTQSIPEEFPHGHPHASVYDKINLPELHGTESGLARARRELTTQGIQASGCATGMTNEDRCDQSQIDTTRFLDSATVDQKAQQQAVHALPPAAIDLSGSSVISPRRNLRSPLRLLDTNAAITIPFVITKDPAQNKHHAAIHTSTMIERAPHTPLKRPRGRPRKAVSRPATIQSHVSDPSKPSVDRVTIEPAITKTSEASGWLNIDEISDSDTPETPSPPRRCASYISPTTQPLDLQPVPGKEGGTNNVVQDPTLTPGETSWSSTSHVLYPRISEAIKSASDTSTTRSNGLSWWDKILLYDPIEVEDLTTWLNNQGLKIQVSRKKLKMKMKKRKKKKEGDVHEGMNDDNAELWELHEEPLKLWMVQKWCEDNGICCLYKENVNHGWRKGRY